MRTGDCVGRQCVCKSVCLCLPPTFPTRWKWIYLERSLSRKKPNQTISKFKGKRDNVHQGIIIQCKVKMKHLKYSLTFLQALLSRTNWMLEGKKVFFNNFAVNWIFFVWWGTDLFLLPSHLTFLRTPCSRKLLSAMLTLLQSIPFLIHITPPTITLYTQASISIKTTNKNLTLNY